ncbi:MAG: hypothetical protein NTU53_01200 [Planctomycetota bacterium]|nr:hypothetical protein [Planctomycetota bacterium]
MTSATQDRVRVRHAGRRHRTWQDAGRAPLGYVEGMNLYEYVGSNPANLTDPMGLCGGTAPNSVVIAPLTDTVLVTGGSGRSYVSLPVWVPFLGVVEMLNYLNPDGLNGAQMIKWAADFKQDYGALIEATAKKYSIPTQLLYAIVAAEVAQRGSWLERLAEGLNLAKSVGPAQITEATALRENAVDPALLQEYASAQQSGCNTYSWGSWGVAIPASEYIRGYLATDKGSIDTAGALIANYLDRMSNEYSAGTMSQAFLNNAAMAFSTIGTEARFDQTWHSAQAVSAPVSRGLLQAMGTVYNYGIDAIHADSSDLSSPRWMQSRAQGGRVQLMGEYFAP